MSNYPTKIYWASPWSLFFGLEGTETGNKETGNIYNLLIIITLLPKSVSSFFLTFAFVKICEETLLKRELLINSTLQKFPVSMFPVSYPPFSPCTSLEN